MPRQARRQLPRRAGNGCQRHTEHFTDLPTVEVLVRLSPRLGAARGPAPAAEDDVPVAHAIENFH